MKTNSLSFGQNHYHKKVANVLGINIMDWAKL